MILDCTIRDGGHLFGWNFEKNLVDETYIAACKSGIDYFEIGYRMHKNFKGIYSKCPEEIFPNGSCKIVVMVNASDFDINDFEDNGNFIVRVACHHDEITQGIDICEKLHNKGYKVFLHLMNIDKVEDFNILRNWKNKNILISLYFADSFGTLKPDDVEYFYKKLQDYEFKNISFHGHNNLQLAYANSLKALELGAYSIDATVYGMGRGAGNLPIELILGQNNKYYIDLIKNYYLNLYNQNPWGYNIKSMLNGLNNLHPNNFSS